MSHKSDPDRYIQSISSEQRKLFKEKLIERVKQIQPSEPWDETKADYSELEYKSFDELCMLLNSIVCQENIERIPAWPPELKQQYPQKINGFRVFLTYKAYTKLTSSPSKDDLDIYRQAIEIALGKYPQKMPNPDEFTGFGICGEAGDMRLNAAWSKPFSSNAWEGFVLISLDYDDSLYKGIPELACLSPQNPEIMQEFFRLCLEVPVS